MSFEAIIPSIKNNFFHRHMINFVNKLELSDQKYQTNGNIRDENYKGDFLISYEGLFVIRNRSSVNVFM